MTSSSETTTYARTLDCVHCGLCLPACPTYRVLGVEADSPRGRIYLMRALEEGRVEDPNAIRPFLDRCLDCRACETACPSGVRYGEILEDVRGKLEQESPKRTFGAWLTRFLLWHVVARQRRLRFAFGLLRFAEVTGLRRLATWLRLVPRAAAELAPPVPPGRERRPIRPGLHRPPAGTELRDVRVALFTGCVMEQMFGRVNHATLRLLLANGFDVDVTAEQGCCGALLVHAGQRDRARHLAAANVRAFAAADIVLNNSAGCGCAMKEYGHLLGTEGGAAFADKCRDLTEFLAAEGLSATPRELPLTAVYDDPCHLCHGQGVRSAPRELLAAVPGLRIAEHDRPEDCCGSAGIYNLQQPVLAGEIGRRKIEAIMQSGPELIITANPGCMIQLDSHARASGHLVPVRHLAEVLLPPE